MYTFLIDWGFSPIKKGFKLYIQTQIYAYTRINVPQQVIILNGQVELMELFQTGWIQLFKDSLFYQFQK